MDHLKAVASLLRKQLAQIEAKIEEIDPKITIKKMRETAAEWYKTKKWKEYVLEKNGIIDNIVNLIDYSYDAYFDYIDENCPGICPTSIVGELESNEWRRFQLKVIKRLISPSKMSDKFDDTAGGCDEVCWDESLVIVKELIKPFQKTSE